MPTPAVLVLTLGALLVGGVLGWLWRGSICRRTHAHLVPAYEPARLETLLHETIPEEATEEPKPEVTPEARPEPATQVAGQVAPGPDGTSPDPAYVVKGKRTSRIYHVPGSPAYARTRADVWFRSAGDAEAAGFRAPKQRGG